MTDVYLIYVHIYLLRTLVDRDTNVSSNFDCTNHHL